MNDYINTALEKLKNELNSFKGGQKENAMKNEVHAALCEFCRQEPEFAQAIAQSDKTFSDCMKAVAKSAGSSISDLEAYKKAVNFYFPGARVNFKMTIDLIGDANTAPKEQEKKSVLDISLDDLF